jgi:hypothetical protein
MSRKTAFALRYFYGEVKYPPQQGHWLLVHTIILVRVPHVAVQVPHCGCDTPSQLRDFLERSREQQQ